MDIALGNFIKSKREAFGLTQREFAEFLGMKSNGDRTVSGWERGEHRPTPTKLAQIEALDTNIPFKNRRNSNKFKFIDLFAGIGGIRLPFQEVGGECVFSSEWDRFSKKTYAANFGELPHGDITQIRAKDIPDHDVLLAGFPCQAFSGAGLRKGFSDTRGTMFFEIQRILAEHEPKAFLLENVKQLKGHDQGRTLSTILSLLRGKEVPDIPLDVPMSLEARRSLSKRLNYDVDFRVLRATDFGVPQKRERVYIVGFHRDKMQGQSAENVFENLVMSHGKTSLGDILIDNHLVDDKYTISDRLLAGHMRRLSDHRKKGNGFGFSVFNRNSPYCNTLSARYYKDGSEVLIDQSDVGKNPRKLTARECARLQGFPEKFNVDAVSDVQSYKQFGNSVSVPVIRALAKEIAPRLLTNETVKSVKMKAAKVY